MGCVKFSYRNTEDLNENLLKLGVSGSIFEKKEFDEARILADIVLEFIRVSKS
jgi:hypothetical protein